MDFRGGLFQGGQFTVEPVIAFQNVFAGLVENLSGGGQLNRSFLAVNQLDFVIHFQLGQLLGDGRLADAVDLGCTRKILDFHQIAEDFDRFDIHHLSNYQCF